MAGNSFNGPNVRLEVAQLILLPPQHPQYHRPYVTELDGSHIARAAEVTNGGRLLSASTFSSIAANLISPSTTPVAEVFIPNTMHTPRYAFYLQFDITSIYGHEKEVIQGYTNYDGVSFNGHLDPEMEFYINSRKLITCNDVVSQNGTSMNTSVKYDNCVVTATPVSDEAVMLRPEDMLWYNQLQPIRDVNSLVIDTRTAVTDQAKYGLTKHNLPSQYLSDVCTAYSRCAIPPEDNYEGNLDYHEGVYEHLKGNSLELSYFYMYLSNGDAKRSNCVKLKEIEAVWPSPPGLWQVIKSTQSNYSLLDNQVWTGAGVETNTAFAIAQMLPAIMSKHALQRLVFSITNKTMDGQPAIAIMHYTTSKVGNVRNVAMPLHSTQPIDIQIVNFITGELLLNVVRGYLDQKCSIYEIYADIDLLSNAHIELSINGGIVTPYSCPMFCDSRFTPLLGLEPSNLENMALSIEMLAHELVSAGSSQHIPMNIYNRPAIHIPDNATINIGDPYWNNSQLTPLIIPHDAHTMLPNMGYSSY